MKTVFAITANNVTLDFPEKMIGLNPGVKILWRKAYTHQVCLSLLESLP